MIRSVVILASMISAGAHAATVSMVGKICEPVEIGHARLEFLNEEQVRGVSSFGQPLYRYSVKKNVLTVELFRGAKDRYQIEQGGAFLRLISDTMSSDYNCE